MILTKHITSNEQLRSLANARDIGAARDLLSVIEIERDSLRKEAEKKPEDEIVHIKLAQIKILNWVLDIPQKSEEYIDKSEGE